MATVAKGKGKKKPTIPTDDEGQPDIYLLVNEQGMDIDTAADAAGIGGMRAVHLLWKQEPIHNPDLKPSPRVLKDRERLGKWIAKQRDEEKVRWERLVYRTGLSKAELMELYEETTGKAAKRLRGGSSDDEDGAGKGKKGKAKAKGKKAKAVAEPVEEEEVDEDEEAPDDDELDEADEDDDDDLDDEDLEEDEEDEEEEPVQEVKPKGRAKKGRK